MRYALVHVIEHRFDNSLERLVTGGASEPAVFLKIVLSEPTLLAPHVRARRFRVQRGFQEEIGERKAARVSHSFCLRALFTKVYFMNLVLHDLGEMNRGWFRAEIAFERVGHEKE